MFFYIKIDRYKKICDSDLRDLTDIKNKMEPRPFCFTTSVYTARRRNYPAVPDCVKGNKMSPSLLAGQEYDIRCLGTT